MITGYSVLRFFAIILLVSAVVWFIFSKKNKQIADSQTTKNPAA
jgi:cbb3-type cytochrome oxidase subunit 3